MADAACYFAGGFLVHNCDVCLDLDNVRVRVDQPFYSDVEHLGPFDYPPAHPACRCSMGLTDIPPKPVNAEPADAAETDEAASVPA